MKSKQKKADGDAWYQIKQIRGSHDQYSLPLHSSSCHPWLCPSHQDPLQLQPPWAGVPRVRISNKQGEEQYSTNIQTCEKPA